jgi:CRISPR-associated protein Csm3
MHKSRYNALVLEYTITPKSPLLVKSGGVSSDPSLPDMQFVRTSVSGEDEILYIPGSSLKGIFRSYVEKVLKTKKGEGREGACNLFDDDYCGKKLEATINSADIYKNSCRACKIFGNTMLMSRISFEDAYPIGDVKTETRYGVAISRLTHAVAQGPFDMEVMVSGSFKSKIHLENFETWQVGLLALVFQGINDGLVRVGFGKNRGFGEVEAKIESFEFSFSKNPPTDEIWDVGRFVSEEERNSYGLKKDEIKINAKPTKEIEEVLYVRRNYKGEDWGVISSSALASLKGILR